MQLADDERDDLRDTARKLLNDRSSPVQVRALLDESVGYDVSLWASMAEVGWPAIHVPEQHGGFGASYADLAVVLHELGRALTPSPMLASAVVAAAALMAASDEDLAAEFLPGVAAGETIATAALSGPTGSYEPSQLGVRWSARNGNLVLDGTARFVVDAHIAEHIVVSATGETGTTVAIVDRSTAGITVEVEETFDQTRRLARLSFDDVAVPDHRLLCDPGAGDGLHDRLVSIGAIAAICDAVGAAERLLEMTTEYAKERTQFGRPIGSFQAVRHHLANMFTNVEASRAAAALAIDAIDNDGELCHAAGVAKSYAGPATAWAATLAIQVLGGIGFTWEHDAHLYLKRIKLDEVLFGTPKWHRRRLAALVLHDRPSG